MAKPFRQVVDAWRKCGGVEDFRGKGGVQYRFPDGAIKWAPFDCTQPLANHLIGTAFTTYKPKSHTNFRNTTRQGAAPTIDLERLTASNHAKDRLKLMRAQNPNLDYRDVLHAIRLPHKVTYSTEHHSWIWVGEQVSVAVHVQADGSAVIATVLWSTDELWESHPRPVNA